MAIALRELMVEVMGQANAVGPTSIEGSFLVYAEFANRVSVNVVHNVV